VLIGSPMTKGISGGQAKRVNIGIALITAPRVLFLDEPTSGLDSFTANEVRFAAGAVLCGSTRERHLRSGGGISGGAHLGAGLLHRQRGEIYYCTYAWMAAMIIASLALIHSRPLDCPKEDTALRVSLSVAHRRKFVSSMPNFIVAPSSGPPTCR
jgi:hypothetical protein